MTLYNIVLEDGANVRSFVQRYRLESEREFKSIAAFTLEDPTEQVLHRLERDPMVRAIEEAKLIEPDAIEEVSGPSWALTTLIDAPAKPSIGRYEYSRDGTGVHAYVIETGLIAANHSDFAETDMTSQIVFKANGDAAITEHATKVFSVLAGREGIAPGVSAVPILITTDSDFAEAIDWVIAHHQNHGGPSVINFSASWTSGSTIADTATTAALNAGIVFVTSAGNNGVNANVASPNKVAGVITVGGVNPNLAKSSGSNWGSVIEVWAPYVTVRTADPNDLTGYSTGSGTSYGSPLVAGMAALILQEEPTLTPAMVRQRIIDDSIKDVITGLDVTDNNRLAHISTVVRDTGKVHSARAEQAFEVMPYYPTASVRIKMKTAGSFVDRPMLLKQGGVFVEVNASTLGGEDQDTFPITLPFTFMG